MAKEIKHHDTCHGCEWNKNFITLHNENITTCAVCSDYFTWHVSMY